MGRERPMPPSGKSASSIRPAATPVPILEANCSTHHDAGAAVRHIVSGRVRGGRLPVAAASVYEGVGDG